MTPNKELFQSLGFGKFYCLAAYLRYHANNLSTHEVAELMHISSTLVNNEETPEEIVRICEFIGANAPMLYKPLENSEHLTLKDDFEDKFIATPPLDYFLGIDVNNRNAAFKQMLKMYDVLIGRVKENGTVVEILCFGNAKVLQIDDLLYEAVIDDPEIASEGSFIKGVVIDISSIGEKLLSLTTKMDILPDNLRDPDIKLGLISEEDLPLHYRLYKDNDLQKQPLSFYLQIEEVHNKAGYKEELDFFKRNSSIRTFSRHIDRNPIPQEECVSQIAEKRSKFMFLSKFSQAMGFVKDNRLEGALGMFQECLEIEPNNTDSLLKCGVINLKLNRHEEAIQNFEHVLMVDQNNPRAKNFLIRSLRLAIEKYEKEKDYKNVILYCKKMLKVAISLQWISRLLKYLLIFGSQKMFGPSWIMDMKTTEVDDARDESISTATPKINLIASPLARTSTASPKAIVSCPAPHGNTTHALSASSYARPSSGVSCATPTSYQYLSRVLQHTVSDKSARRNSLSSSVYKPPQKRKSSDIEVSHSTSQIDQAELNVKRKPESAEKPEKSVRVYRSHSRRECPHRRGPKRQQHHYHHRSPSSETCDACSSGMDEREETSTKKHRHSYHRELKEHHCRSQSSSYSHRCRSRSRERSVSSDKSPSRPRLPWMSPTRRKYDVAPVTSNEPYGPQPPPRYSAPVYRPTKIDPATGTSYFRESAQQAVSILHSCLSKIPEKGSQNEDKENK